MIKAIAWLLCTYQALAHSMMARYGHRRKVRDQVAAIERFFDKQSSSSVTAGFVTAGQRRVIPHRARKLRGTNIHLTREEARR